MAGTAMGVGVVAAAAILAVSCAAVGVAVVRSTHAAGAADAAALAAADAAAGAIAGVPCERAATVAEASDAVVIECELDGLIATVRVRAGAGPLVAEARARAGPPPASP